MRRLQPALLLLASSFGACHTVLPQQPEELDLWDDAAAGVRDPELADLAADYWEAHLAAHPIAATYLGDARYGGELPRTDPRSQELRRDELVLLQRRLEEVDQRLLGEGDRVTHELLAEELEKDLVAIDLDLGSFTVDPLGGLHVAFLNLAHAQPQRTPRDRDRLLRRWRGFAGALRQTERDLRRGKLAGRLPVESAVVKTIQQIEEILATPPMDCPLVTTTTGGGRWVELSPTGSVAEIAHEHLGDARFQRELRLLNPHLQDGDRLAIGTRVLIPATDDPLSPAERGELLYGALIAVETGFYPALASYRSFLRDDILLAARPDETPGLVHVPGGAAAYRALVRSHTSLPADECDPQAIHDFGLAEVARIRAEMAEIGARVLGTSDVATIQSRLRHDPALHFETREEVQLAAEEALARATAAMDRWFGIVPEAPCEVVRIAPHEERDTTIAYYREPSADGRTPGRYFINTYAPETRPRYEAEVLAYHEAIPGHHLQIAIAQERSDLPRFRRHLGSTAFVEGWALYSERLSDEMGLYSGDLDRLGVLSFDAWRASRLVVDTGIHALGWSRDEAIAYLYDNTLLARNNVENEVDRYIAWPGQALAYKLGQREILELRAVAQDTLGPRFDAREFHDRVLENGAVSLSVLRGIIGRWLGVDVSNPRVMG